MMQGDRRRLRGVAGGIGVVTMVVAAIAAVRVYRIRSSPSALLAKDSQGKGGVATAGLRRVESAGPAAHRQVLSEADLYTRSGAAEDIVAAQNEQKAAAQTFVMAVLDETDATRKLAEKAQLWPDTMEDATEVAQEMEANEAEIRRLGRLVQTAGATQITASALYVQASQKRYTAVEALQAELAQEAQDDYDIKAAVVGTTPDRFDPTSENAPAYDPADPKQDKYHIAKLVGVDSDGSASLCGRAEVKHDDTWGTICSRGFTQTSAEMFCKSMGLTGGTARYHDEAGNPTWDDTVITHLDPNTQPDNDVIWMSLVNCNGGEPDILQCPFGDSLEGVQDWKHHDVSNSGCSAATSVGLCCDVSEFCPPRSHWRPDAHVYAHKGQMYGDIMRPEQQEPDMISNCKCDAGFYMDASTVYSGKCTTCPINSCSPIGSTSIDHCVCLEGFYKTADNQCQACPANSCSARGIDAATGVNGCKCFAGYYMSGGECVMCPEATTSKAGSTSADECDTLCGLPDSANAGDHAELVATAAENVASASSAQRAAADAFAQACAEETAALKELNEEMLYTPPATLSKDDVDSYSADVTHLQTDADKLSKYSPIIATSGATQVSTTAAYLAEVDKLNSGVADLEQAFADQMKTQHHIKEALTRCQPTVACVPSPCMEAEPSNPCEPWPSCYPHPCEPWPSCSTTLNGGGFPEIEQADPTTAKSSSRSSVRSPDEAPHVDRTPLLKASKAQELAKTEQERVAAKAAVDKALKSYDTAAGFNSHQTLHFFTSDDSAHDVDSEKAYAGKRHEQEEGILEKIKSRMDKAVGDEVLATLHGVVPPRRSGADVSRVGDPDGEMEKSDGNKDSLYKLFAAAKMEQEGDT